MAQQERRPKVFDRENRREGSRWIGARPDASELAEWFRGVKLHEGMQHEDHIGGITLISAKETQLAYASADGREQWVDLERLTHTPYPRVDARLRYFWMLCELRGWHGVIAPVSRGVSGLPPGFGKLSVELPDRRVVKYITCTQKVSVFSAPGKLAQLILDPPPATKQVASANRWGYADENLLMKAETGAIGRALGMAGMFVIPGAGVATAEDMHEFQANSGAAAVADQPELPDDSTPESLDERIGELMAALDDKAGAEFSAWLSGRGWALDDLRETQKRGVLRRLEQLGAPVDGG